MRTLLTFLLIFTFTALPIEAARKQITLTIATKGDPVSMDPGIVYEMQTHSFLNNIYEALVGRDDDLKLVPALAESWENRSPNYWVFHLRRSAKFHNGQRLRADDVVFSFKRFTSDDSDVKSSLLSIKEIEKLDEFTVGVKTKTPTPTLLNELFALKIMSKNWCEKHKAERVIKAKKSRKNYADLHACGTGPYQLESRKPDIKTVLKRHILWWGDFKGNLQQVVHRPVASASTRVSGLLSGEFDCIEPVPLQDIERLNKNESIDVLTQAGLNTMYMSFNMNAPELKSSNIKGKNPFSDLRVRQAIYHAVDVETLCEKVLKNIGRPAGLLIAPGVKGYADAHDIRLPYDPDHAKTLLKEAGYEDGFKVTIDVPMDRFIKDEDVGKAVVSMLAKVGITARLNAQPKSKFFEKILSKQSDFHISGWMPATQDVHAPYVGLTMTAGEGTRGAYNFGKYSNPEMDELLTKIHSEMNSKKRQDLVNKMFALHEQDLPQIPLYQEPLVLGKQKNITMKQRKDGFIVFHMIHKKTN